jgi:hypothetical protein
MQALVGTIARSAHFEVLPRAPRKNATPLLAVQLRFNCNSLLFIALPLFSSHRARWELEWNCN